MLTLAVKEALEMGFILRRAAIFTMVAGLTVSALAHFREQSPAARGVGSAGKARLPAAGSARAAGEGDAAARAERYLNSVRDEPGLLVGFLARMPKGGDLHNHLSGAVYAESYIDYAAADGDCVDLGTSGLLPPPCDASSGRPPALDALSNATLRNRLIDAWSVRNFHPTPEDRSVHDHFFAAFSRFGVVAGQRHWGDMMAEVVRRAAAEHEVYIELLLSPDAGEARGLLKPSEWSDDFSAMRSRLLDDGMAAVVAKGRRNLDEAEARMRQVLGCGGTHPDAGCSTTVRYQFQVLRALPRQDAFSQMVAGFEMAAADPRVVGLNLVQPEDDRVALRDFALQMRMLDFLHGLYPKVHISLHAGELAPGLVRPDDLGFHIRESIEKGHAERIGHGVDVMQENNPLGLLAEMARRHVLVEICLTSNDLILGVRGRDHPLPIYLRYGVPVALATDDEGVARSELTWEYLRAVETYHLEYATLKRMVRDSLDHSFLPGASLWTAPERVTRVAACSGQALSPEPASAACRRYLDTNEKARIEWKEEVELGRFEAGF
ncbi:MAG TPA: adenosine deaminase [Terriglobia bacterium]|nr:adenosine deaminase [Terriglobia bacterium]